MNQLRMKMFESAMKEFNTTLKTHFIQRIKVLSNWVRVGQVKGE